MTIFCPVQCYRGTDCFKCSSYLATQSGKYEELEKIAINLEKLYRAEVKPEYLICDGCRAGERHSFVCANSCKMRRPCIGKDFFSCIECSDFPCL
ncbi:MAG: hypothetical protein B6245_19220 [Desulfobacteraceae bacterium 4572_88]|nr:MAG: hypothetical protein B6245_19220 [Desulfobacteraceae bacterium 4572_88]RLC13174.1 MAG: hypothetical protein DRI57_16750 [Deltaproteobacteria bacterium]